MCHCFLGFFNVLITFILATDLGAGAGSSVPAAHGATAVPPTLATSQGKYRTHAKINDTLVLQPAVPLNFTPLALYIVYTFLT